MKKFAALLMGVCLALPGPLFLVGCDNAAEDADEAPVQENGGEAETPKLPTTPPGKPE